MCEPRHHFEAAAAEVNLSGGKAQIASFAKRSGCSYLKA